MLSKLTLIAGSPSYLTASKPGADRKKHINLSANLAWLSGSYSDASKSLRVNWPFLKNAIVVVSDFGGLCKKVRILPFIMPI